MLERQAAWQAARRDLPWPEKIRMAEILREAALQMQASNFDTIDIVNGHAADSQ